MALSDLPTETIEKILSSFSRPLRDRATLSSCSLVSRQFVDIAQRLLYEQLSIRRLDSNYVQGLVEFIKEHPRIASHVWELYTHLPYNHSEPTGRKFQNPLEGLFEVLPHVKSLILHAGWWSPINLSTSAMHAVEKVVGGKTHHSLQSLVLIATPGFPITPIIASQTLRKLEILETRGETFCKDSVDAAVKSKGHPPASLRLEVFNSVPMDVDSPRHDLVSIDPSIFSNLKSLRLAVTDQSDGQVSGRAMTEILLNSCSRTLQSLSIVCEQGKATLPHLGALRSLESVTFEVKNTRGPKFTFPFHAPWPTASECLSNVWTLLATMDSNSPVKALTLKLSTNFTDHNPENWRETQFLVSSPDILPVWKVLDEYISDPSKFPSLKGITISAKLICYGNKRGPLEREENGALDEDLKEEYQGIQNNRTLTPRARDVLRARVGAKQRERNLRPSVFSTQQLLPLTSQRVGVDLHFSLEETEIPGC
ncbi:hypothetical protein CC1G_02955 [Coprinopsis cinerea okayama7|uniref:Uncharacterized protein n=1 Tax=Coprinopsis cinerea (strain Okayama-7 / 130 / ATCC MYA-4618 / FGSC 9003) TaxID=240176 RepID=A8NRV8_COPC7|nr:hypothetical protein CC1G_02955 [Coprinopsis cinerea okayama7\|eukprot:XP_001835867.2 hypothetical protein CC1G_02955 [Coprinopsis cinerea okayama7\